MPSETPSATRPAWCEFPYAWAALAGVALINAVWIDRSGVALPFGPLQFTTIPMLIIVKIGMAAFARTLKIKKPHVTDLTWKFAMAVEYIVLCDMAGRLFVYMSYIVCGWNYPLVDQQLQAIDLMLGFDRVAWLDWSQEFVRRSFLGLCYATLIAQTVVFAMWYGAQGDKKRLYEIFWILFVSITATVVLSGFLPVLGPAHLMGLEERYKSIQPDIEKVSAHIQALRAGQAIDFSHQSVIGIIYMPSFHAIAALVMLYGFRKSNLTVITVVNFGLLAATPFFGNHYLADIFAGMAIAAGAILLVRAASRLRYFSQI